MRAAVLATGKIRNVQRWHHIFVTPAPGPSQNFSQIQTNARLLRFLVIYFFNFVQQFQLQQDGHTIKQLI